MSFQLHFFALLSLALLLRSNPHLHFFSGETTPAEGSSAVPSPPSTWLSLLRLPTCSCRRAASPGRCDLQPPASPRLCLRLPRPAPLLCDAHEMLLFDRDWKKIEAYVGSKTVIQIRSHAQKYFMKVQKNGTGEHLPPPRPKRKAAHPYPQKASKNVSQAVLSQQPPPLREQGCAMSMDTTTIVRNTNANAAVPSWDNALVQPSSASHTQGTGAVATNNCSSSIESPSGTWPTSEAVEQENVLPPPPLHAMPDFAQVYNFLGSIFDPDTSGHLQRLKAMDPIDVETVLLLMRNLSMNLTSPDFEAHRKLLSSHSSGGDQIKSEGMENPGSPESCHLPFMVTSE